jgi:hypothetical protein
MPKKDVTKKTQKFICPECGIEFILEGKKLGDARWNKKRHKAGLFCSRVAREDTVRKYKWAQKNISSS